MVVGYQLSVKVRWCLVWNFEIEDSGVGTSKITIFGFQL